MAKMTSTETFKRKKVNSIWLPNPADEEGGSSGSPCLKDFETPKQFLLRIYNCIAFGKHFEVATQINGEFKYGNISLWDNKLFFHAFSSFQTNEEAETITFQDIQKCLAEVDFGAFLEIIRNEDGIKQKIFIKMLDKILVPQFLRLCTGESGPVYKGAPFYQRNEYPPSPFGSITTSIIKVDASIENAEDATECIEHNASFRSSHFCNTGDIVLTMSSDIGFEICYVTNKTDIKNVIGKIEEPSNLKTLVSCGKNSKIVDCGIAINL